MILRRARQIANMEDDELRSTAIELVPTSCTAAAVTETLWMVQAYGEGEWLYRQHGEKWADTKLLNDGLVSPLYFAATDSIGKLVINETVKAMSQSGGWCSAS